MVVLAALMQGAWIWAALIYLTLFMYLMDQILPLVAPNAPEGVEFPAADGLSVLLGLAHFGLLGLALWAIPGVEGAARVALFLGFGLFFGQIGNSNAHELIHRGNRGLHGLGKWMFISMLFGHHCSAHPLVHHRFVATPDDPNSARLGEGFYRFAPRAWIGSFGAGWRAEAARPRARIWARPYVQYVTGALAFLALAWWMFGAAGLLSYVLLAGHAQAQLLLSDYVQHYGLRRGRLENGRFAPVTEAHSWNAPHWFSGFLMLNAPRHSDHHAHPGRRYPALQLPPRGATPTLPASLPAMASLALFPTLWRRVMDPRAKAWLDSAAPAPTSPEGEPACASV